jgi:hypothetical protein
MPALLAGQPEVLPAPPWTSTPTAHRAANEDENEVRGVSQLDFYEFYEALTYPHLWKQVKARVSELHRLRDLQPNWDTYNAEVPSNGAIVRAENALSILEQIGYVPNRVVASAEGGVALCFTNVNSYADIEFTNSGETLAVAYKHTEEPEVWTLTDDRQAILDTAARIYNRSNA